MKEAGSDSTGPIDLLRRETVLFRDPRDCFSLFLLVWIHGNGGECRNGCRFVQEERAGSDPSRLGRRSSECAWTHVILIGIWCGCFVDDVVCADLILYSVDDVVFGGFCACELDHSDFTRHRSDCLAMRSFSVVM